ncbi:50S ribosomal protein L25 [Buchnera aphidicola]|uniref:50S ribosomal protein L25 n=1 Tax=Buchnera aphidicola (Therioaphis trifolii) TaxID=1241884 RepID=A0A4D6YG06_9GAMM|nr:50S ribosomal protein L25 [Buchnera aphidicola]QCI27103.1 50S ribosomal protein L25 [Buchnera aphidicola (Therioaphis trifolii)]
MIIINGEERLKIGKSASRKLRKIDNKIPGIIYGLKKNILHISLDHDVVFNLQENEKFYTDPLMLRILGKKYLVSVQSVQRHCFKKKILHIDFLYKKH